MYKNILLLSLILLSSCSFEKGHEEDPFTVYNSKFFEIEWSDGTSSASPVIKDDNGLYSLNFLSVPNDIHAFDLKIPKIEGIEKASQVSVKMVGADNVINLPVEMNTTVENGYLIRALIDLSKVFIKNRNNQLHIDYGNKKLIIKLRALPKKYSLKEIDREEISSYFSFPVDEFNFDTTYFLLKAFAFTNNEKEKVYITANQLIEEEAIHTFDHHNVSHAGKCGGKDVFKYSKSRKSQLTKSSGGIKLVRISGEISEDLLSNERKIMVEPGNTIFVGLYYSRSTITNLFGYPNRGIQSRDLIQNTGHIKAYTDCCEHYGHDGGVGDIRRSYKVMSRNYRCGLGTFNTGSHSISYTLKTQNLNIELSNSTHPSDQVLKKQSLLPANTEEILLWQR